MVQRFRVGLPEIPSNSIIGVGNDGGKSTPPYALSASEVADIINPYLNFNVQSYVVAGDTGFEQAINRAITAANAQGGGNVIVQNFGSTYTINSPIVMKSLVRLYGQGRPTLKLANNANCTIIESLNYQTLHGTQTNTGTTDSWAIENFVLDGNMANNTGAGANSGHGVATYGRNFYLRDLYIQNTYRRGATIEYTGGGNGVSPFNGRIDGITTSVTGAEGIVVDVSDCHVDNLNVRSPSQLADNTYDAIAVFSPIHAGGRINVWRGGSETNTHRYGIYIDAGASTTRIAGAVIETAKTANIYIGGDNSQVTVRSYNCLGTYHAILNAKFCNLDLSFFAGPIGTTTLGLKLGDSLTALGNIVKVTGTGTTAGLVDFVNSGGVNNIVGTINFSGTDTLFTGTPGPSDDVTINANATTVTDRKTFRKLATDTNNFVAFGTTFSNATLLRHTVTKVVTNDGTGTNGVKLPAAIAGSVYIVTNNNTTNAVSLWVFPHSAGKFVGSTANTGVQVPINATWMFINIGFDWAIVKSA